METFQQTQDAWKQFISAIVKEQEVIAPVKTDCVRFQEITSVTDINLTQQALHPAKKYFFRQYAPVFTFTGTTITIPAHQTKKRVFFGLRRCDLNAIANQDTVFLNTTPDPDYKAQRANSTLIGLHCQEPLTEYCFCGSLDLKDCFDLMYYQREGHFVVEVGSSKGKKLVTDHKNLFTPHRPLTQDERTVWRADRLKTTDIDRLYDHPAWEKEVNKCLSCAACTALCPTCYCYEIHDNVTLNNLNKGERIRSWSSCQLQEFTRVAGNHIFRKERTHRFKHRIYHQLSYFKQKHNTHLCVGCGRCIAGCPTRIDFVRTINEIDKMQNGS